MRVNSKRSKRKQKIRRNSNKEKEDDFAINKELSFGGIRLGLVYTDEIEDFERHYKCTPTNCTYGKEGEKANWPFTETQRNQPRR